MGGAAAGAAVGATWAICALAIAGVIVRPWRLPEWIWALAGAAALLLTGLFPIAAAGAAAAKAADVCLFLSGMMLLSETARANGLFDWVAMLAVDASRRSRPRLFLLVYATGTVVTIFLSNDATAVVLTPAVLAAAKQAEAEPLPLLFACALIANAASFVLPISNPANLVLYGGHMPPLGQWLAAFALPSIAAILATFVALRLIERRRIAGSCAGTIARAPLSTGGKAALGGIVATAALLLLLSALDAPLGLPTAIAGLATALGVAALTRASPLALAARVSWGVLPLVVGLFVVVAALDRSGITAAIAGQLARAATRDQAGTAAVAGAALAIVCNLMNNLPAGLVAATAIGQAHSPPAIVDALLIGVDLGPNLSITGSLATILWLQAIRREGQEVGFGQFLKVGMVAMPAALAAALGARLLV